jgi:trehalose 6-phosphate synthase/phosphatase
VLGADNARKCQTEMEKTVGKKWDVEVMAGKANLEVRPTFINKGEIVKRLVASYGQEVGEPPEDMFRALMANDLPDEHIFTIAVGASSKPTLAQYHLLEPTDVVSAVALLNGGATETADLGA